MTDGDECEIRERCSLEELDKYIAQLETDIQRILDSPYIPEALKRELQANKPSSAALLEPKITG